MNQFNLILIVLRNDGSAHYFPWIWDENNDDGDGDYGDEITAEQAFVKFRNGCKAELEIPATGQKTELNLLKFNKQKFQQGKAGDETN